MKKTFLCIMLICIIFTYLKAENKARVATNTLFQRLDSTIGNAGSDTYLALRIDKTIYSYNPQNQTSEIKYFKWNSSSSKYELSENEYYIYDSSNRPTVDSSLRYSYNTLYGVYITKYIYNSDGTLQEKTDFSKANQVKSPYSAETIRYGYKNHTLLSEEHLQWEKNSDTWTLFKKVIHYADQNGNDTLVKTYSINASSMYLTTYTRNKITYAQNNNKKARIKEDINVSSSDSTSITNAEKYEMTYDNNNNIITSYFSTKASANSNYSLIYRLDYTYDLNSNFTGIKNPIAFRLDEATNRLTGYHVYSAQSYGYAPQAYIALYYSNAIATVLPNVDTEASTPKVFYSDNCINVKNIAKNATKIQLNVYDANGRKWVTNAEINTQNNISMPNLPSGIYVYTINSDTQNFNGKFIVK